MNEATERKYKFDRSKIDTFNGPVKLKVTSGQLQYELGHLLAKLKTRDPQRFKVASIIDQIPHNSLFEVVPGDVESWEKIGTNAPEKKKK